jgi:hypothetical protein
MLKTDSIKCLKFISHNNIKIFPNIKYLDFITHLYSKMEQSIIDSKKIKLIKKTSIPKIVTTKQDINIYHTYQRNFENINDFYDWYNNNVFNINLKSQNSLLDDIIYKNPFVSSQVHFEIESNDIILCKYTYEYITINYFHINKNDAININNIIQITKIMSNITNNKNSIIINIINTDLKKQLSTKKINPNNVNSGSCLPKQFINIWRTEEINKVLFHELIHFYELHPDSFLLDNYFQSKFGTSKRLNIIEAYVETMAIIIHTLYVLYKLKLNKDNLHTNFTEMIKYETNHSLFQVAKILNHYKIKNMSHLMENFYLLDINTNTSVFSYYIVKCALLCHIDEFIKFISHNINFNGRESEFIYMIEKSLSNMGSYVDNYDIDLHDVFIKNNLRMSCFEII